MWVYKYIMYCMNKTTKEVNKVCSQDYRVCCLQSANKVVSEPVSLNV